MKRTFIFFAVILSSLFHTQNFEHERSWGTYFGATGGQIAGVYVNKGVLFDSQQKLHIRGGMWNMQNNSSTYFNQFLLGGGTSYLSSTQPGTLYTFETRISALGTPSYYGYDTSLDSALLEKIDHLDNKYYIIFGTSLSVQASSGVYLSADPQPSSAYKVLLVKYSPAGSLLWSTYLPSDQRNINLEIDDANNVYVSGTTKMSQNVATSGVFEEDYDIFYDGAGNLVRNGYLLKLSPNGQRIWGTYMHSDASSSMQYFNGSLYMLAGGNTNPSLTTMATPGAFQASPSSASITKMDATNGARQWGTYYGPSSSGFATFTSLAVNESGLYVAGTDYNYDGSSFFGTPSSYKQFVTGDSDIFLSKFSLAGNREWSTYFGSSASDMNEFDQVIALNGGDVYITGNTYGSGSNIATPGSYQPTPEFNTPTSYNFYFAKFSSSGVLSWCSYYGGSPSNSGIVIPINVAFSNNVLYLYGSTNSNNGYTTEGAFMPVRNPANTNGLTCFIARFDNKNLGTTESDVAKDLVLFDNPNNGNFSLQGTVLTKNNCNMTVYDLAGRLITQRKLSNQHKQYFEMQHLLQKGNYMIKVSDGVTTLKTFKMIVK